MIGPALRSPPASLPGRPASALAPSFAQTPTVPAAQIVRGEMLIDGVSTFLYGGEVQYFRVRDGEHDAAKTHAMWAQTLDAMVAAKMNVVTTYVPWDYHATAPGQWSFSGTRDLTKFLELCKERGLRVMLKPGPLITAEWPRGFGTFGAVPAWWKEAHPEALELTPNGKPYKFGNFWNNGDQAQPALLHPTYLKSVGEFYKRFADEVRPYLGNTVIAVQIDNETNHYWASPFGGPGYSPTAIAHWRDHLRASYGTVAKLNAAYGTAHASFEDVTPPVRDPKASDSPSLNAWNRDWYDAGQRYIVEYLRKLRSMLEQNGVREPDILFFVNDSPFTLSGDRVHLRNVRLPDGTKREVGRLGIDIYPKWLPGGFAAEAPWQADYFSRRFSTQSDIGDNEGAWLFGAELQAGTPIKVGPFALKVPPYATDQLLLRAIGRGVKGSSLYIMRDGLNADNSTYSFGAPLNAQGETTPRYEVAKRWGEMLQRIGPDLQRSREVTNSVAILVNERHAVPQAGVRDNMQNLHTRDNAALFGWLQNAGFNPVLIETNTATAEELAKYKVVFSQNPDVPDDHVAALLADHPGTVVSLLGPGQEASLADQHGVVRNGGKRHWIPYWDGKATFDLGGAQGQVRTHYREEFFAPVKGSQATPFMWSGKRADPNKALGWLSEEGDQKRVLIGSNVYAGFNYLEYFYRRESVFEDTAKLARSLAGLAGEKAIVTTGKVREIAWARRSDEALYVFCANDNRHDVTSHVSLHDGAALGLVADRTYEIREELHGSLIATMRGAELLTKGLKVPMTAYGTAVLRIT